MKLVAAAIKITKGKNKGAIYTGKRHADCFARASLFGSDTNGALQGFTTDDGEFLTRDQALPVAIEAKQLLGKTPIILTSEDLW